jgi:hypothetical protein
MAPGERSVLAMAGTSFEGIRPFPEPGEAQHPHRVIPGRAEREPDPIERHGRVAGLCGGRDTRRDENRAAPDDVPANGSRLCGRFAALAGMTAEKTRASVSEVTATPPAAV